MKKIGVCGHFAFGKDFFDGQTVKTRVLAEKLVEIAGRDAVCHLDTYGGMKAFPKILLKSVRMFFQCKHIVILPAQNGVRTILPIFVLLNFIFRRELSYAVIGGWLADMVEKSSWLVFFLKRFSGIYVETTVMKKELEGLGFSNVFVLLNPKRLKPIEESEISECKKPVSLCFFSRVMEKKGIEDAISAVKRLNAEQVLATLDIYGAVDPEYQERFLTLKADFPAYIRFWGAVPAETAVQVLKQYDLQLFPTRFPTEGIPGSVIDGYFAGVPVLAAEWESFSDVVEAGKTGVGFAFGDFDDFYKKLETLCKQPQEIFRMKQSALRKSKQYQTECEENIQEYFLKR